MRIIYRRNSEVSNRWRIDFHPNERIGNVGFIARILGATAPESHDFVQVQRVVEEYCSELDLQTKWCIN